MTTLVQKKDRKKMNIPTWNILELQAPAYAIVFRKSLDKPKFKIADYADDLLITAFPPKSEKTKPLSVTVVKLVLVSVAELGFPKGAKYSEICAKAKLLGLGLCPPEVGPTLRQSYVNQPIEERLQIAMEALKGMNGYLGIFVISHRKDKRLWLDWHRGHPDTTWFPSSLFVFLSL